MLVYLNGTFLSRDEARVSVDDRGFLFGDGVYEVCRVAQGRLFEYDAHMARLERGMRELRLSGGPDTTRGALGDIAMRLLRENDLVQGEATVYMQITRGAAPRTHAFPPEGTTPTVYLSVAPFKPLTAQCANGVPAISLPDIRWSRCDLKTVNLLPNVLGKQRAVDAGAVESVFFRGDTFTEGASTNLFGVVDGVLRTHPKDNHILPGITRDVVLELAAERHIPVGEEAIRRSELRAATELFLTGTTTDVMPIVQLDGAPIGTGVPGPVAKVLLEGLSARIAGRVGATV